MASSCAPDISFAVACFNALPFLEDAILSALRQEDVEVEVLIVDDGSSDASVAVAQRLAEADARVRLFQTPENRGPAGARNIALAEMHGRWFAVLDSDDWIDPARSRILVALADEQDADVVADNLILFGDEQGERPLFAVSSGDAWQWLSLEAYFARSRLFARQPGLGFLKPMIRQSFIERFRLRYNESLRIGEDDELVVRMLAAGARYAIIERPLYHYRKHLGSISHRLSVDHAERMLSAEREIREIIGPTAAARPAYRQRWRALRRGVAFTRSVEALKHGKVGAALAALLREPCAIPLYRYPISALHRRLSRRFSMNPEARPGGASEVHSLANSSKEKRS